MCACKETDARESTNVNIFAGGLIHGSRGEACYATFDENPVSSFPERGVVVKYTSTLNACFTGTPLPWPQL
jgi:hypothetical protein